MTSLETPSLEKEIPLHEEAVGGRAPERTVTEVTGNLRYDDIEEEPELHARTYVALAALFVLNMVQVRPPRLLYCYKHLHMLMSTALQYSALGHRSHWSTLNRRWLRSEWWRSSLPNSI